MTTLQIPNAGQATTAGTSSLTDTSQSWQTNIWTGYVVYIVAGTGSGQAVSIVSNDSSTLTIQGSWVTEPDHSSFYEIKPPRPPPSHVNLFRASNMVVVAGDPYPSTHDGTSPVMPFDGTLEIDIYSTAAQNVEMAFGTGAGSAESYVFVLTANVYQHIQLELKSGDAIELYFNNAATVALCLGARQ